MARTPPARGGDIPGLPRMVRLLTHDVNNPLTAIRILAEMNADGEVADDMLDILEAADLAAGLLEAMDALMREEHRRTYSFFPVPVDQLLASIIDRPALRRLVRLDVQPGLRATGDASALERAFTDIFFHARQLGGGEQVFVQARQADAFVEVVVSHGAARIPAELRSELFVVGGARQLRDRKIPVLASGLFYARSAVVGQGGGMEFRDAADGSLELVIRLVRDA